MKIKIFLIILVMAMLFMNTASANYGNEENQPMFKYNLGQVVWYKINNTTFSAPILSRKYVDRNEDIFVTVLKDHRDKLWEEITEVIGYSGVTYATMHGTITEDKLFRSRKELEDSLEK